MALIKKFADIIDITTFQKPPKVHICWYLYFRKGSFFADNLKIHAFQPASDRPQDTAEGQNLSDPKTYDLTPAI